MGFIALALASAPPYRLLTPRAAVGRVRKGLATALDRLPHDYRGAARSRWPGTAGPTYPTHRFFLQRTMTNRALTTTINQNKAVHASTRPSGFRNGTRHRLTTLRS